MAQASPAAHVKRFTPFELDLRVRQLRRHGLKVNVQGQPIEILAMLLERPGELVTRDEIEKRLWPNDTVVEFEHSINAAIKRLREALSDSTDKPRYIETLARRGYRFIARVDDSDGGVLAPPHGIAAGQVNVLPRAVALPDEAVAPQLDTGLGDLVGKTISHYRVLEKLGSGGMGVVYMAQDTTLGRKVALKFLPDELADHSQALERFQREARSASALNHPNICTIYEVGEDCGRPFIAMELLEGQTLDDRIGGKPLRTAETLEIAIQIADALQAAHAEGIIHRDIKPANIMITNEEQAKVLDFGLAKLICEPVGVAVAASVSSQPSSESLGAVRSRTAIAIGTAAYMSPEQARGEELDSRTDLFSFGAVLYEMATGRQAFSGDTPAVVFDAILNRAPVSPMRVNAECLGDLGQLIKRALEKDRGKRYQSARDLSEDLRNLKQKLGSEPTAASRIARLIRTPLVVVAGILTLIALISTTVWWFRRSANIRWAREKAIPEITQLIEGHDYGAAFALARKAERHIPSDPALLKLWDEISFVTSIHTTPEGADVYIRDYSATAATWEYVGRTPIPRTRIPAGSLRWQIRKQGFLTVDRAAVRWPWAVIRHFPELNSSVLSFVFDKNESVPAGMVKIAGGKVSLESTVLGHQPIVQIPDCWMDRYEVTNKQFKQFVDADGYRKPEYWKEPFVENGRTLSLKEAMAKFQDRTGRPGPSAWELGDYPEGQAEYPVTGVSWYEAAAYAEYAGKSLPTVYHWINAAETSDAGRIIPLSNFKGQGLSPVGSHQGMSRFGNYDMAGNAKEWCWNAKGSKRFILGGAWNEPPYMFYEIDAQSPFDRAPTYGFRCLKYLAGTPVLKAATDPVSWTSERDYRKEKPVSEGIFTAYKGAYAYDKASLSPVVESVDENEPRWRKEKITFNAAYGNERMIAYLFLPKHIAAPYQTVIYFPGSYMFVLRSDHNLDWEPDFNFILKSGRAVIYPIYKGTYERGDGLEKSDYPDATIFYRDHVIDWSKDLGRTIDYIETRQDLDHQRLAYYGVSWGAYLGNILPALEKRIKVLVLVAGGFILRNKLPEVDEINFAPRVAAPALMINGRYDSNFPLDSSQSPMFRFLGAPEKDKRHAVFESGHFPPHDQTVKETLDWLDRYLGPAK